MSSIEKAVEKLKKLERSGGPRPLPVSSPDRKSNQPDNKTNTPVIHDNTENLSIDIQLDRLKNLGYISPENMSSQISEEYRIIKRPLLMNAFGKGAVPIENGNLVAVLSAIPGEGKTFTALNLSISISMEKDTTILLVDSDVTNPSLSRIFQTDSRPGLLDVLSGKVKNIGDVIHKTSIPSLSFIPAGTSNPYAAELLASESMYEFVREIANRYTDRIVIFDAPPVLATSHASILAQLAGQILVVVEAGKTLQSTIREAVSKINGDKVIGMVLNKSRETTHGGYYYGSYGHEAITKEYETPR